MQSVLYRQAERLKCIFGAKASASLANWSDFITTQVCAGSQLEIFLSI
jgi:hypothetical protein